jgi:hypothetical protein
VLIIEQVFRHGKWLTHIFEEIRCCLYSQIDRQILETRFHLILDPLGKLILFITALESRICKHHESVIVFASEYTSHTLRNLSHGIESEKIILPNLESIIKVFHSRHQVSAKCVLIGYTKHKHTASIVSREVNTL